MDPHTTGADDAHVMKLVLRYQRADGRSGRFGRKRGPRPNGGSVPEAEARKTMQAADAHERPGTVNYEVDPHAVAGAIVERLIAGRTLPPPVSWRDR